MAKSQYYAEGNFPPTVQYVPNEKSDDPLTILKDIRDLTKQIKDAIAFDTVMQEINLTAGFAHSNSILVNINNPYNAFIPNITQANNWIYVYLSGIQAGTPDFQFGTGNPQRIPFPTRTENKILLVAQNGGAGTFYICRMRG